ncbi:hypothetical protein [Streptomyces sp. NBC_00448]|uniref:hypothetical protein n=1 Tax=Streptomyces sp. NBC_00448 TaxID=2903652 RepID=UPI002E224C53
MNRHFRRRTAAFASAALTTAALTALCTAAPASASADDTDPVITLQKPAAVAVPTAAASGTETTVQPDLEYTTDASSVQTDATITIDARRVAKIANVSFSDNCTVENNVATCWELFYDDDPQGQLGSVTQMTISALPGVAAGATATYTVSGTATAGTIVGGTGSVQVGGPAFDLQPTVDHTGLAVGSTVDEPVQFTNTGDRPAAGAQLLLMASPGLGFAQHYANCKYSEASTSAPSEYALCTFTRTIQTGEKVALATPVQLNVTTAAYYTYLDTQIVPKGDPGLARTIDGHTWTEGTGGRLALTVLDPGTASSAPAGKVALPLTGDHSDYRIAALTADNTADFSVTGDTAQGAVGDTVDLHFSMTNNGPATLYDRSGSGIGLTVTLPPGTTVVGASAGCYPDSDVPQERAHGPYDCGEKGDYLVPAGHTADFSLTVRIDQVTPGAQGTAAIAWSYTPGWRPPYDPDGANDSAPLTLN